MAIYGRWDECAAQMVQHAGFARAFEFIREAVGGTGEASRRLRLLGEGESARVDLDGDRIYAVLQHVPTRLHAPHLEAHRQYADVQFVLHGEEFIDVASLDGLQVTKSYHEGDDYELLSFPAEPTRLFMRDGYCAVLFPSDAHAPLQARNGETRLNRRIVVKVKDPLQSS